MSDNPIMNVADVAAYLKCDQSTIYRLLKKHKLPGAFKTGRDWKFDRESIDKWRFSLEQEHNDTNRQG